MYAPLKMSQLTYPNKGGIQMSVDPTVSITLAAYNAAPYLAECLDSILGQTFSDFELIVVEDCSSDNTAEILKEYAAKDSRISLIFNSENSGLSFVRNTAVAAAKGKYVVFLDSDDVLHREMLTCTVSAAEKHQAEMVMWDYISFSNPDRLARYEGSEIKFDTALKREREFFLERPAFAWTKLIRRDALLRLAIHFPLGFTYQDVPVHWQLITQLDRIIYVPEKILFYRQHAQATTSGQSMKRADFLFILDQVEDFLKAVGLFEQHSDQFTKLQLNAYYGVYDVIAVELKSATWKLIEERMTERHISYLKSGKPMRWQARAFFLGFRNDPMRNVMLTSRKLGRTFYRKLKSLG